MGNTVILDFLDTFARAWNGHDVETIVSMMTLDAIFLMSGGATAEGRRVSGREELRKDISAFFKSMPDARWNEAKHFIAGDRGVTQWVFTATRPDGSKVESKGCDVFTFRDGLIAVKDSYRKQPTY
jgi:ketosteroid isomerase-like protein